MITQCSEELKAIQNLFAELERTPGRNDKQSAIDKFEHDNPSYKDDLKFCFEILTGKYKIGFTLSIDDNQKTEVPPGEYVNFFWMCKPILYMESHTQEAIDKIQKEYIGFGWFLNPLLNRAWRLGINSSQLGATGRTPMLAKKYEPEKLPDASSYFITQKLDGNRCCAIYSFASGRWLFYSRSGKQMDVKFDMTGLPTIQIFDGEILSKSQILNPSQANFNTLSGLINSKDGDKSDLVYTIFDVKQPRPYSQRRAFLQTLRPEGNNVRILPVLAVYQTRTELEAEIGDLLYSVTSKGGEGLMINLGNRLYEQRRTDALLKVKNVYSMDMKVLDIIPGTGKNTGLVGSLECYAEDAGNKYSCQVGSGLSDAQRAQWADHPEQIIGKIVEIKYFSESQPSQGRGGIWYSLRFPRFERVRDDKKETSIY